MSGYFIKRLFILLVMLILVSMVVHAVLFFLPGDPAQIMLGLNATPETVANLKAELGLDKPFWVQYWDWIWGLMRLHTGRSLNYDIPVMELISSPFCRDRPGGRAGHALRRDHGHSPGHLRGPEAQQVRRSWRSWPLPRPGWPRPNSGWHPAHPLFRGPAPLVRGRGVPCWGEDFWGSFKAVLLPHSPWG